MLWEAAMAFSFASASPRPGEARWGTIDLVLFWSSSDNSLYCQLETWAFEGVHPSSVWKRAR